MSEKLYHESYEIIRQSKALLEHLEDWGFSHVYEHPSSYNDVARAVLEAVAAEACQPESLGELEASLQGCQACQLCQGRTNIVFGQGNPAAELVFVGEAPGREEDQRGLPFVGEAGQLLEKILFAMGLTRDAVYICNVIKCRPPGNRDPQPDEIAACEKFLQSQLAIIKPRMIVTLGRFAAHALLKNKEPVSRLRGNWSEYQGIPLMPTFHPAYLLRNPVGKRDVWQDMKQVMARLKT